MWATVRWPRADQADAGVRRERRIERRIIGEQRIDGLGIFVLILVDQTEYLDMPMKLSGKNRRADIWKDVTDVRTW